MKIKKHWAIIIIVILGLTPMLWYKPDYVIAKGDYSPFYQPAQNIMKYSYAWADYNSLGSVPQAANPSVPQVIWMDIWAALTTIGLSLSATQIAIFIFYFLGSGLSMYFLASTIYRKEKLTPFIASIFYMFNFYVLLKITNDNLSWCYMLMPLVLGLYARFIGRIRTRQTTGLYIFAIAISVMIMLSYLTINPAILVLATATLIITVAYAIITQKGIRIKILKLSAFTGALTLLLSLWWIIPFIIQATPYLVGTVQLGTTTNVLNWTFVFNRSSIINLLGLNGLWSWTAQYFPYYQAYSSNLFLSIIVFLPIILAAIGLTFKSKYSRLNLTLALAIVTLMFLAKGLHPPLENINLFLYKNLPGSFLFREPFPKLYMSLLIPLSLLIGFSCNRIKAKIKSPILQKLFVIFIVCCFLSISYPLLTGEAITGKTEALPFSSYVKVPDYWYQATNYINSDPEECRVLVTPNDGYYQVAYSWGFYGGDALPTALLNKPVITQIGGGYTQDSDATTEVFNRIALNQSEGFVSLLSALNVKYILQRNDIEYNYAGRNLTSPEAIKAFLSNQTGITFVKQFGQIDIYQVSSKDFLPKIYLTSQLSEPSTNSVTSVTFEKVNPTKYTINLNNLPIQAQGKLYLVFSETYDPKWQTSGAEAASNHSVAYGYANAWVIDVTTIRNSKDCTLVIYYEPQNYYDMSAAISVIALTSIFLFCFVKKLFKFGR